MKINEKLVKDIINLKVKIKNEDDIIKLSQNTNDQYSAFTVNLGDSSLMITGATSVGSGTSIYDSILDKSINIRSITSDTTNKISVLLDDNIELIR